MFIQVIQGRTSDAGALRAALDRWAAEVAPSAMASSIPRQVLRRTAGSSPWPASSPPRPPAVTAPGPSRTRGGAETAALLDGEVTFRDSEDVDLDLVGDPDRAGFVQIMQGWTNDPQRARELMASSPVEWGVVSARRPRQRHRRPWRRGLDVSDLLHVGSRGTRGRTQGAAAGAAGADGGAGVARGRSGRVLRSHLPLAVQPMTPSGTTAHGHCLSTAVIGRSTTTQRCRQPPPTVRSPPGVAPGASVSPEAHRGPPEATIEARVVASRASWTLASIHPRSLIPTTAPVPGPSVD